MLVKNPAGVSPRFSVIPDNFPLIAEALDKVGHVVLENVFDRSTLQISNDYAQRLFTRYDQGFSRGEMNAKDRYRYNGSAYSYDSDEEGIKHHQLFMEMIGRSPILDVFSYLLRGDFAAIHGPQLRRATPSIHKSTGLHMDGQVTEFANEGYYCKDEYTMWTPFCDVDEMTPGLLLIARGHTFKNMDINLTPLQLKAVYPKETPESRQKAYDTLNELIDKYGKDVYAPQLKMGSVILFRRDVLHSAFAHDKLTHTRYSADIRFISDFDKNKKYCNKESAYLFKRYFMKPYGVNPQEYKLPVDLKAAIEELIQERKLYFRFYKFSKKQARRIVLALLRYKNRLNSLLFDREYT